MMKPNQQTHVNKASQLGVKGTRIELQLNYLKNAAKQQFLPRGIGDQMKFTSSVHDFNLQNLCQHFMYFAGSRVLDIMIAHYTRWHDAIRSSYYCELNKLGNLLDTTTFDQVMVKINGDIRKERLDSQKRHTHSCR